MADSLLTGRGQRECLRWRQPRKRPQKTTFTKACQCPEPVPTGIIILAPQALPRPGAYDACITGTFHRVVSWRASQRVSAASPTGAGRATIEQHREHVGRVAGGKTCPQIGIS